MHGLKEPKPLRRVISAQNGTGAHAWAESLAGNALGVMVSPLQGQGDVPLVGKQVGGTAVGVGGPHNPSSPRRSPSQGKQALQLRRREHNDPVLNPQPS